MGFDCFTVEKIQEKDKHLFPKMSGDKGYFRYSSGVTAVLSLMGVSLDHVEPRLMGDEDPTKHDGISLARFMGWNNGFQVTPKECAMFADAILDSPKDKLRAAVKIKSYQEYLSLYPCCSNPDDMEDAEWEAEVEFFELYGKFCRAASQYGGFLLW